MVRDRLLREERLHAEMARIYAADENNSQSAMLCLAEREQAAFYLAAARMVASLVRTRKATGEPTERGCAVSANERLDLGSLERWLERGDDYTLGRESELRLIAAVRERDAEIARLKADRTALSEECSRLSSGWHDAEEQLNLARVTPTVIQRLREAIWEMDRIIESDAASYERGCGIDANGHTARADREDTIAAVEQELAAKDAEIAELRKRPTLDAIERKVWAVFQTAGAAEDDEIAGARDYVLESLRVLFAEKVRAEAPK